MRRFGRLFKEQKGFTLIELIATLSLISIVSGLIYSVLFFGINSYHKIQIENSLRDEGDLMVSSILSELYTFGPSSIETELNDSDEQIGITLEDTAAGKNNIIIRDKKLQIGLPSEEKEITIKSELSDQSSIKLSCKDNQSACTSGLIEIHLVLEQAYNGKVQQMALESKFGF